MKYAICALLALVAIESRAQQNLHDYALKRSLYQDGLQYVFTVLDSDKRGVLRYDFSKTYFWLKAQRVVSTQGASSGDLLHGNFEAFYPSKQLARKGRFDKGLKDGSWYYWREDGTLLCSEHWNRGKKSGKQVMFDQNGQEKEVTRIKSGGSVRSNADSTIILKIGDRKVIELRDSTGTVVEVQRFKNNELHGAQTTFEKGKQTSKVRYKNGELMEEKVREDKQGSTGIVSKIKQWFEIRKVKRAEKKAAKADATSEDKSSEDKKKEESEKKQPKRKKEPAQE